MPKNRQLQDVIMGHHIRDGEIASADIAAGGVDVADLASGVTDLLADKVVEVTTAGGSATEALTVAGVTTSSKIIATLKDDGTNNVTIKTAKATGANTVTVVFSGDPSSDAIVAILAF